MRKARAGATSEDHGDFRLIGFTGLTFAPCAVLALALRDERYSLVSQAATALCILSFGSTLALFSRSLRRHGPGGS